MADVAFSVGTRDRTREGLQRASRNFDRFRREATQDLQAITRTAQGTFGQLNTLSGSIGNLGNVFGGLGIAGAGGLTAITAGVSGVVSQIEELSRVTNRYGVDFEAAFSQSSAIRIIGRDISDLEDLYGTLLERVGEFALGEQTATDLFGALGLGLGDVQGRSGDEVIAIVAGALRGIEDTALQAQAAIALGGDEVGKALLDLANSSDETFDRLTSRLETLSQDQLQILRDSQESIRTTLINIETGLTISFGNILEFITNYRESTPRAIDPRSGASYPIASPAGISTALGRSIDGLPSALPGFGILNLYLPHIRRALQGEFFDPLGGFAELGEGFLSGGRTGESQLNYLRAIRDARIYQNTLQNPTAYDPASDPTLNLGTPPPAVPQISAQQRRLDEVRRLYGDRITGGSTGFGIDFGGEPTDIRPTSLEQALEVSAGRAEAALAPFVRAFEEDLPEVIDHAAEALQRWQDSMVDATGALTEQGVGLYQNSILLGRNTEDLSAFERGLLQSSIELEAIAQLNARNNQLQMLQTALLEQGNEARAQEVQLLIDQSSNIFGQLIQNIEEDIFGGERRRAQAEADRARREAERLQREAERARRDAYRPAPAQPVTNVYIYGDNRIENIRDDFVRQYVVATTEYPLEDNNSRTANFELTGRF